MNWFHNYDSFLERYTEWDTQQRAIFCNSRLSFSSRDVHSSTYIQFIRFWRHTRDGSHNNETPNVIVAPFTLLAMHTARPVSSPLAKSCRRAAESGILLLYPAISPLCWRLFWYDGGSSHDDLACSSLRSLEGIQGHGDFPREEGVLGYGVPRRTIMLLLHTPWSFLIY